MNRVLKLQLKLIRAFQTDLTACANILRGMEGVQSGSQRLDSHIVTCARHYMPVLRVQNKTGLFSRYSGSGG